MPFTFVAHDNSTCYHKDASRPRERDYTAEIYLTSLDGRYWETTMPLKKYYKPEDVFICCYESPTYGKIYSDGYGLNFYTREYGYYEYNQCGEYYDEIRTAANAIVIFIAVCVACCVCVCCYYCCKKKEAETKKNERKEVYMTEQQPQP